MNSMDILKMRDRKDLKLIRDVERDYPKFVELCEEVLSKEDGALGLEMEELINGSEGDTLMEFGTLIRYAFLRGIEVRIYPEKLNSEVV